jgi:S-adenosyl-L-methionine hydrolase (adenosine-forming)
MKQPVITLLTDFGSADHYAGAMKGVMLGICPEAQLVDISHEIAPYAIAEAAYTLARAWRCFPKGTVHLIVVDPGVGSARRPILADAAGHRFVAPDNGVLTMVFDSVAGHKVREITSSRYFRQPVSQTFHGRDIFAPVAARLAAGVPSRKFGRLIADYIRGDFAKPVRMGPQKWTGAILKFDRFGNMITNFEAGVWQSLARQAFEMKIGRRSVTMLASSYAEMPAGELCAIAGSAGFLEVSLNQASAAAFSGARPGEKVNLQLLKAEGGPR